MTVQTERRSGSLKGSLENVTTNIRQFLVLTAACTCTMEVGIFACILLLIAAREDDVIELRPAALPLCVLTTILEALPAGTDWCPLSTIPAAVNQT